MNKLRGWYKRFFFFILFKRMNKMLTYLTQFPSEYIQKRNVFKAFLWINTLGMENKNFFFLLFIYFYFYLQWKSRWCIMRKLSPVAGMCKNYKKLFEIKSFSILKINSRCSPKGILLLLQKHTYICLIKFYT